MGKKSGEEFYTCGKVMVTGGGRGTTRGGHLGWGKGLEKTKGFLKKRGKGIKCLPASKEEPTQHQRA